MSKFGIILFAILAHLATYAAEPRQWYAPQDGWEGGAFGSATIYTMKDGVITNEQIFEIPPSGKSEEIEKQINIATASGNRTLAAALQALYEALQAQVMAKNTSDNLNAMLAGGDANIVDSDNIETKGTYKFDSKGNLKVDLDLKGIKAVKAGGGLEKDIIQNKISISGWDSKDGNSYSIADVLSGNAEGPFANYGVLARMAKSGSMDYVRIGRLSGMNSVDNESISTNASMQLELKGFQNWKDHGLFGLLGLAGDGGIYCKAMTFTNGLTKTETAEEYRSGAIEAGIEGWDSGPCEATLSKMLTDKDDENRSKHLLLARFEDGDNAEMHYVPIGDAMGKSEAADGASITTNSAGRLQLAGFSEISEEGLVPVTTMTGGDGEGGGTMSIGWIPATGAAIRLVGTDGSSGTVGSGSLTNTVTFASATNSYVEVSVKPEVNGNITVKIGVYYR